MVKSFDCGDDDLNDFILQRFNNRKRLKSYPAVKIGRLGVSNLMKGKNIGSFIMNFIKTYFINNNKSGCLLHSVSRLATLHYNKPLFSLV